MTGEQQKSQNDNQTVNSDWLKWLGIGLGSGGLGVILAAIISGYFGIVVKRTMEPIPNQNPSAKIKVFLEKGNEKEKMIVESGNPEYLDYPSGKELTLDGGASKDFGSGYISKYEWLVDKEFASDGDYYIFQRRYGEKIDNKYRIELTVHDDANGLDHAILWIYIIPEAQQESASYEWIPVEGNRKLSDLGAFKLGEEHGEERFLCRVLYEDRYRIGKTVDGKCNFPYYESLTVVSNTKIKTPGEDEPELGNFYVLKVDSAQSLDWVSYNPLRQKNYPKNSIKFVGSAEGEKSYICKAFYQGAEHPGIVDQDFCVFSYGNAVGFVPNEDSQIYEILVESSSN
jgi:hypothetical protein